MSIRILWKYHKNIKNDAGGLQSEKMVSKSAPNGTKREPEDSQGQPKGSRNGAKREPKGYQNASKSRSSEKVAKIMKKGGPPVVHDHPFWEPFSFKNALKNQCKNRWQKSMRNYEKMLPK